MKRYREKVTVGWQQIPALEVFSPHCYEKGQFVAAAKEDGDLFEWHLFHRLNDESLEPVNGVWATIDKTPQAGLEWAEGIIDEL